jgi:hypothetical protein
MEQNEHRGMIGGIAYSQERFENGGFIGKRDVYLAASAPANICQASKDLATKLRII